MSSIKTRNMSLNIIQSHMQLMKVFVWHGSVQHVKLMSFSMRYESVDASVFCRNLSGCWGRGWGWCLLQEVGGCTFGTLPKEQSTHQSLWLCTLPSPAAWVTLLSKNSETNPSAEQSWIKPISTPHNQDFWWIHAAHTGVWVITAGIYRPNWFVHL